MASRTERRRTNRVRTLFAAQAIIGNGLADVACEVRNLSAIGARVIIGEQGAFLPDRFELRIARTGACHQAEVRWRTSQVLGVEFTPDLRDLEHRDDPHARIEELEAEVAMLRRKLTEMADRLFAYGDTMA